jgi:hypothetical protein
MNDEEMIWKKNIKIVDESRSRIDISTREIELLARLKEANNKLKARAERLMKNYNASKRNNK